MSWDTIVKKAAPYIVKIETQSGSGTGFLCGYNQDKSFSLIATALHVVRECEEWEQSLKIYSSNCEKTTFFKESERVIFTDRKTDSAVLFVPTFHFDFPQELIQLRPMAAPISIGHEVGWLGYPAIDPWTLCFFSGSVSARREDRSAYLIDGVAINGVSGGPVLFPDPTDGAQFVGAVSAYRANWQSGDALPGLLFVQDVSHFHKIIKMVSDMDEAKKKKAEEDAKKKQMEGSSSSPGDPTPESK